MSLAEVFANPFGPFARLAARAMWRIEHAFERARASDKALDDVRLRIFFVLALFAAGFVTLSVAAARAALFSDRGRGAIGELAYPNARGDLVDRNGQLLAVDLVRYGLYLDPREIVRKWDARQTLLGVLPRGAQVKLDKALAGDRREFVVGGLTPSAMAQIHDLAVPGLSFEEETGRAYPLGLAAHVIGFASKDGQGLAGAERAFNADIRAGAGRQPVALSLDLRVQGALEDELAAAAQDFRVRDAVGMVVNVRTGEILGMASWPSFDPNAVSDADPATLVNHAAATVYEPGSVMKVFTLAMGLDAGVASVNTLFDARTPLVLSGQTIHDFDKDNAMLPLWEVFTHSSNIGAARLGLLTGSDRFGLYFKRFGLFAAAPSQLAESARPLTPRDLTPNAVASMSFGHAIAVSPLAIATGMSAVLNGGVYRPLTLRKLEAGQAPAPGQAILKPQTSRTMLGLMRLNVTNGTGTRADIPGLRVGGKTGTATKIVDGRYDKSKNLSSFAAIFPTDGPLNADRYLVLIMLDQPQPTAQTGVTTGGMTAAPVAGRVIERIAPFVGVRRIVTAQRPPAPAASNSAAAAAAALQEGDDE
jgi:cell division protein FtsI (penicillin-binding protein 3)